MEYFFGEIGTMCQNHIPFFDVGTTGSTTNDHAFTVRTSTTGERDMVDSVLDELRVYGAELSARQVRLLHAAGLG